MDGSLLRDRIFLAGSIVLLAAASVYVFGKIKARREHGPPVDALATLGPYVAESTTRGRDLVIVEFGDYQCAPCYSARTKLDALIDGSRRKVAVVFRNLPLSSIHPQARDLAFLGEVSRIRGTYPSFLKRVLASPPTLDMAPLTGKLRRSLTPISQEKTTRAAKALDMDAADASRLGIDSTPTFLLVRDGEAFRMDLDQLSRSLSNP